MMRRQGIGPLVSIFFLCVGVVGKSSATEPTPNEPGPVQRIEETAKRVGKSIEETVQNTKKKLEEERLPEKAEKKAKQIVDDVVEGVEQTGKNIEKKFR